MIARLQLLLLLGLALTLTACSTRRGGGGGGSDDDDSAMDDDDVSDDDDSVDDDDATGPGDDDDDLTPGDDDDTPGDDDDTPDNGQEQLDGGFRYTEVDFGPDLESQGAVDCEIEFNAVDPGLSVPGGCPNCDYLVAVTYEVVSSNCANEIDDITDQFYGFSSNGTVMWYSVDNGQWGESMFSNTGSVNSSGFYGETGFIEGDGYEVSETLELNW